jgi:serine/threonine-protein kinase
MAERSEPEASSSAGKDPFDLCGVTIDAKYRVSTLVGSGGFGVVYRGVHAGFDEPIAIKCLKVVEDLDDAQRTELLTRLRDEGRVLHRLSKLSSGIVQALDVGGVTTPNGKWVPYLVLEWLEGETLGQHLKKRLATGKPTLSLEQALELLEPAARALEVAHRQKVAHRDVKPENLYLTEVSGQRTLKVLDFGIAKVLSQHGTFTAAPAATQKQPSAFTPSYGAPEQFNKKRGATGPWTDVFALALILVEAISGERALEGDDATQLYIASADPSGRPTLRYHGVETSNAVEKVLARALAVEPGDRYQEAGAFWNALAAAAGKKTRVDPAQTDISDTGDFVSRHDIELEPKRSTTSGSASDESNEKPTRLAATKREGANEAASEAAPVPDEPAPAPKSDRPAAPKPRAADPEPQPKRATKPSAVDTTVQPAQASSRWLPLVVVLALAGAALLYVQLQGIGPSEVDDGATTIPSSAGATRPSGGVKPASSAAGEGGGADAGDLDAGDDADAAAPQAPAGMVYVARESDAGPSGFFIDIAEVTTGAYEACVMADRCTPATRIVLTVEAARALGGVDPDLVATPEQLANAWQPRCNALRKAADHPINCVKHPYAEEYCRHVGMRLPSNEEWSLAAGSAKFPWGDEQPECATACFGLQNTCVGSAREVATCTGGTKLGDKSVAGLFDMAGNVAEWVSDKADTEGDGPAWRMLRGGSFVDEADMLTAAAARALPPSSAHVSVGFRCAADAPAL